MVNSSDPDLWYFSNSDSGSTKDIVAVQAQAGKVFVHQSGGRIKFPDDEIVNNNCLCKFRYMRYYAFYQKVQDSSSEMPFFNFALQEQDEDTQWIDYNTTDEYGYKWQICAGPIYLGCQPVGYLGDAKWHAVNLPYSSNSDNISTPSPSYVFQTHEPNRSSLKMRIVCSYKCCNNLQGCGIPVGADSNSFSTFDFPVCAQDFYVSNILKAKAENKPQLLKVHRIRGTEQCCVHKVQKKFIQHSCDAVTLRVWHEMNPLPGQDCTAQCPECFEELEQRAKGWAMQKHKDCVYWVLWVWPLNNCDKASLCDKDNHWHIVDDLQGVPAEVLKGYGEGWQPPNAHDPDEQIVRCGTQATAWLGGVYQWTFLQKAPQDGGILAPPGAVQGNPCQNDCQRRSPSAQGISDSASFSGSRVPQKQKPCNEPDPQGKRYLYFFHDMFNVWYLQVWQADPSDLSDSNPCHPVYKIKTGLNDPTRLDWHKDTGSSLKYDYQLLQKGWFAGLQFKHFKGKKDKYYIPLQYTQDPPETAQQAKQKGIPILRGIGGFFVQDTTVNLCGDYYQVYYMGCGCKDLCSDSCSSDSKSAYISSNVCTKWRHVGRLSYKKLQQLGLCVDRWVQSTVANTFSTEQAGPIGEYVYTAKADQDQTIFCPDYPQAPVMNQWYDIATITPKCSEDPRFPTGVQEEVQWQHDYISYDKCKKNEQTLFIQGWKLSPQLDTVLMPQDTADGKTILFPGEACTVYYLRKRDLLPDIAVGDACDLLQPDPVESDSKLLDNVIIKWNLSKCLEGRRLINYRYIQCQITPTNRKGWSDPLTWTKQKWTGGLSDSSYIHFNWGWVTTSSPATAQHVVVTETGDVIPKVDKGQNSPNESDSWYCKIYYIQKLGQHVLCGDKQDYSGSQSISRSLFEDIYSRPSILWNQLQCLQFHKYIKYAWLEFQTPPCPFQNGAQPSTTLHPGNARGWKVGVKQAFKKAGTQDQYSDSTWKWGWLDIDEPGSQANSLTLQPVNIVRPCYSDSPNGQFCVCTAYYVHKVAELIDVQQEKEDFQAASISFSQLPVLDGTTIYWTSDCYSQYGRWARYWQATVTPSCGEKGQIYNAVQWDREPITRTVASNSASQSGWFHPNGTPAAAIPNTVIPDPGSDCTLIYKLPTADGIYYCKQQIPQAVRPFDSLTEELRDLGISWASKCLKLHRAVTYMRAAVTPGQCGTISDSITWQAPQTLFPGSDTQQIFDQQGNPTYTGGWSIGAVLTPILVAPPISGTVISPAQNICTLYYFKILQDIMVCARDYTYSDSYSQQDLSAYAINWSTKCQGKTWYLRYAYKIAQQACSSDSIVSDSWVYGILSDSSSDFGVKTGWYQGQDLSFPIAKYLPPDGQGVSWVPYGVCKAVYLALGNPQALCQKPQDNLTNPTSGNLIFQLTRWVKYSYAQVIPDCANSGFVYGSVTTEWKQLSQNQQPVASGTRTSNPYTGSAIDMMAGPVSCASKIYYLVQGQTKQCCNKPSDTTVVYLNGSPAIVEGGTAPSAGGLAQDCYTTYYYKWERTRQRVCDNTAQGWVDQESQWQGTWVQQKGTDSLSLNNCKITHTIFGQVTYCKSAQRPSAVPQDTKPSDQWPSNTPAFGNDCPSGAQYYYYWSRSISACCGTNGSHSTCGTRWTLVTRTSPETETGANNTAPLGSGGCSRYQLVYAGKRCTTGYNGYTSPATSVGTYQWDNSCYPMYYYYFTRYVSACCAGTNTATISTCATAWTSQTPTTTQKPTGLVTTYNCSHFYRTCVSSTCRNDLKPAAPAVTLPSPLPTWDKTCITTWSRQYCYVEYTLCDGAVASGNACLTGNSATLAALEEGWYNGADPKTATKIAGTAANCNAYYITLGNILCNGCTGATYNKNAASTFSWPDGCKNYKYYYTLRVTPDGAGNWVGPTSTTQNLTTGWYVTPTANNCVASYRACVLTNACPGLTPAVPGAKQTYTNWPEGCEPCIIPVGGTIPDGGTCPSAPSTTGVTAGCYAIYVTTKRKIYYANSPVLQDNVKQDNIVRNQGNGFCQNTIFDSYAQKFVLVSEGDMSDYNGIYVSLVEVSGVWKLRVQWRYQNQFEDLALAAGSKEIVIRTTGLNENYFEGVTVITVHIVKK